MNGAEPDHNDDSSAMQIVSTIVEAGATSVNGENAIYISSATTDTIASVAANVEETLEGLTVSLQPKPLLTRSSHRSAKKNGDELKSAVTKIKPPVSSTRTPRWSLMYRTRSYLQPRRRGWFGRDYTTHLIYNGLE
ncbi:hypothetical protein Daus18300_005453 [Diaporthe australafricana]|uniref:Uncharacterized protein n=1 Tax=Diaporthe australafricana TaxID=127596 RepID=A0ABR3X1U7_9PEZI